jgi:cobalt-zinc-cadmium efflux system membrane fusion protein
MKKHNIFYSFLIILLVGCNDRNVTSDEAARTIQSDTLTLTDDQYANAGISYGSIENRPLSTEIKVQGKVDLPPQNIISINFSLGGYLKNTKLIPGMKISKGEVIAIMEDQAIVQLQQDYLLAKAKQELAKKEYERQKALYDANAATSKVLQQVDAELKIQSVNMSSLAEKLKMIGIDATVLTSSNIKGQVAVRSPINGYVSKVNVNTGKYVQPTETLFELIDPDDIHVAITLFEKDLPNVKKGDLVKVSLMQEPGKTYDAEVIIVNSNIDEDRTALAHCHFLNHPKNILPGMLVEATIVVKTKMTPVLPEEAIIATGDKKFIFLNIAKLTFKMMEISTGAINNGYVEILSDTNQFKAGSIVTAHAQKLFAIKSVSDDE